MICINDFIGFIIPCDKKFQALPAGQACGSCAEAGQETSGADSEMYGHAQLQQRSNARLTVALAAGV